MIRADSQPTVDSSRDKRTLSAVDFRNRLAGLLLLISMASCSKNPMIEELVEEARFALRRNDHVVALKLLEDVLKRQPLHQEALLYRAQLSREMKDDSGALVWLAKIPDDPSKFAGTARYFEGSIALAMNKAREAEKKLLRSIELNPNYIQPHERLLQLYSLQRRKAGILGQIHAISQLRALQLPELALNLTAGERMFEPKVAIPQLEPYVIADSEDDASQLALAMYYNEAIRPKEAIAVLRSLVASHSDNHLARATLVEILVDQQDTIGAGHVLESTELTESSPIELWYSGGLYLLACEEWKHAAECFAVVADKNTLDRSIFRRLGLALQRLGETDLAEIALHRTSLIAQLRDHCETLGIMFARKQLQPKELIQLADLLAELEEPDRASVWYEQALKMEPGSAQARAGLLALQSKTTKTVEQLLAKAPRAKTPLSFRAYGKAHVAESEPSIQTGGSVIRFRDDHDLSGLNFSYFNGESGFKYIIETMGGGVGIVDFDHDGWPDIFFPQGNDMFTREPTAEPTWHDQLFRNLGGIGFAAVPAHAGTGDPGYGQGIAVGDFNNDGFDDLLVTNFGRCTLLQNQGDGTFVDVSNRAGLSRQEMSTSAGWADFDQDGLLDLFVVNYVDRLRVCRNDQGEISTCNPSNHTGVDDRVYRNLCDGRFDDASLTSGLAAGGKGLGVLLADLDDDGLVDVFVSNDTTPNFFYRNRSTAGRLQFVEEGLLAGVALSETGIPQAGMGIACGDLDGDQRLDLYVTYFYGEANGLYLNIGDGVFRDATRSSDLYLPTLNMLGFGTQAVDFDLDGHLDLVVANGHIDDQSAIGIPWKMRPQLFVSRGGPKFTDRSGEAGDYFQGKYLGRGVAQVDWNRDGRQDLVIVHQDRPVALLTNITEPSGNFIEFKLRSPIGNRNAIGARVNVTCAGQTQRADVTSGDGFYCANEQKIVFGIKKNERVERLEIIWPGGARDVHFDLPANSRWIAIQASKLIPITP